MQLRAMLAASSSLVRFLRKIRFLSKTTPPFQSPPLMNSSLLSPKGFEPDLEDQDQRTAFRIYRKMRFGNPNTFLSSGSSQEIAQTLKKYPRLKNRIRFRNYVLKKEHKSYPVTPKLSRFLDPQFKSVGRVEGKFVSGECQPGLLEKSLGLSSPRRTQGKAQGTKLRGSCGNKKTESI